MRKFSYPLIAIAFCLITASCTTKFNIAAPYKNITVVYGLLDQSDTAHYIRIQKAFLDNSKNSLTMAQVADSSYYPQLDVMIERLDNNSNVIDTIHLDRVDMNLEGYQKQAGLFFTSPNYAYKFKDLLNANYTYRLIVKNLITGNIDSAQTPVIVDNDPTVFGVAQLDETDPRSSINKFNFASVIANRSMRIYGSYIPANGQNNPVGILQAIIRFNWSDSNGTTNTLITQYYDYDLGYTTLSSAGGFTYIVPNTNMYNALVAGMGKAPAGIYRLIGRCQLFVYSGTSDFNSYYQASLTQGIGLTGTQIEPNYTNIQGKNALGLFAARGLRNGYVTITTETVDSLLISPLINPLCNIVNTTYHYH